MVKQAVVVGNKVYFEAGVLASADEVEALRHRVAESEAALAQMEAQRDEALQDLDVARHRVAEALAEQARLEADLMARRESGWRRAGSAGDVSGVKGARRKR